MEKFDQRRDACGLCRAGRPLTFPGSEFWNRLSFTENWNWSTCVVSDFDSIGVYSQVSINRRQEVPYANSSFGCVLSMTIRGADNLASDDATPAEKEGHGVGRQWSLPGCITPDELSAA